MNYFTMFVLVICALGLIGAIYNFFTQTKEQQINNIKEWLLYAVLDAERLLGSNTGRVKLRYVYDLFVSKFRVMSFIISFEQFSMLVDEALDVMRDLIENNKAVKAIVESDDYTYI